MVKETSILEILFWVIMTILFIMILTRIFGHSATDIQIYLVLFSGLFTVMGYIVKLNREIGEVKVEINNIKMTMINSFAKVRKDINEIKRLIKKR